MIALGSDHGGFDLKERVKAYLDREGIPYQDYGCHSKESCDYPVFGKAAAEAVASGVCEKGIVICTTGIGISIAANKVRGIRCALCSDPLSLDPFLSKANVGGTGNSDRRFFLWGIPHVSSENRGTVAGGFLLCLVLQGPL